ncbi:MAG: hypothetical protein DYG89_45035 [Caldilinea sp. CFX5]|nr:hypothetical protein [Caldilinea sp. CFX5]
MLINPDHVKYAHEEYERRVAAFQMERKAQRDAAQVKIDLVGRALRQAPRLITMRWNSVGRSTAVEKPAQC